MDSTAAIKKSKLLIEFVRPGETGDYINYNFSKSKLAALADGNINNIFVISSKDQNSVAPIRLLKEFSDRGFNAIIHKIEGLDENGPESVIEYVQEIFKSFESGGCLIISHGSEIALPVVGCFIIYSGRSVEDAIDFINKISTGRILSGKYISFLYSFQKYLNEHEISIHDNIILKGRISEKPDKDQRDTGIDEGDETAEVDGFSAIAGPEKAAEGETSDDKNEIAYIQKEELTPVEAGHSGPSTEEETPSVTMEDLEPETTGEGDAPVGPVSTKSAEVVHEEPSAPEIESAEIRQKPVSGKTPDILTGTVPTETEVEIDQGRIDLGPFYKSIRFKLVSIISCLVIVALTGMIILATYFFKKDNIIRLQENNQKVSDLIGMNVFNDLNSIIKRTGFITSTVQSMPGPMKKKTAAFFEDEKEIIFAAVAKRNRAGTRFIYRYSLMNADLLSSLQIYKRDILKTAAANYGNLSKAFSSDMVVLNVSRELKSPVIAVSIPFELGPNRNVLAITVVFINFQKMMDSFKTAGIIKPFMVNDRGDVIGHHDSKLVMSGENLSTLPIVKNMMESRLDNGLTRYVHNDNTYLGSFKKIGFGGAGIIAYVEEELALQEVYNIQRRNIYLMISILSVAVVIVFIFGRSLTRPLIRLLRATHHIKKGIYRVDIRPASDDEIGQLTSSFIEMGVGLEEREKMKDAFGKFVNEEIANQVLSGEIHLGGERKSAAVFFSDIRSFTEISEKLEPEEVVEFLNDYMTRMVNCVYATDGVVDKYIGDAIMAEWGVPVSRGNDTENAINAALMMRKALHEFNEGRGGDKKPVIRFGCGINTGPVVAGQIGSEDRMEYTVIGDTVNLASRIEALTKPFGSDILISQDSYNVVKDIYQVEKMSLISVKGKKEKQQIYAVLGRFDDPDRPKTIEEMRALTGLAPVKYNRRKDDRNDDEPAEEVKYEIHED